ncbi:MAG: hypothetical protein OEO79_17620 [Gemmatimonadota bacterium]|nr:hypothetical protein [Gemmatimonadota bacterium]
MVLFWLIAVVVIVLVAGGLATRQLPSGSAAPQDHRLAEQAEQIEQLEAEVHRLQEQADFTEKLLTERSGAPPREALDSGDVPD